MISFGVAYPDPYVILMPFAEPPFQNEGLEINNNQ